MPPLFLLNNTLMLYQTPSDALLRLVPGFQEWGFAETHTESNNACQYDKVWPFFSKEFLVGVTLKFRHSHQSQISATGKQRSQITLFTAALFASRGEVY